MMCAVHISIFFLFFFKYLFTSDGLRYYENDKTKGKEKGFIPVNNTTTVGLVKEVCIHLP